MTTTPAIFFITGEVSGDRHAAPVVEELCRRGFRVVGAGGERMKAAGAELLADSSRWGAMGVPESLRKTPMLYLHSRGLLRQIRRLNPAVVVLVDFGYFNVRMAAHVTRMGGKVLYYFPPGSWRQELRDWSRLAAVTDCIATPFARNAEHLRASGANAHWVGHPIVDALVPVPDRAAFRASRGLPAGDPVVGLLPGSRPAERRLLGPRLIQAAAIIRRELPHAQFLWSSLPQLGSGERALQQWASEQAGATPCTESHDILRAADLVLVAMGTATLEAAAALTPMLTTYDGSRLGKWIAGRVLKQGQPFYSMPNLLLGREVVPEVVPRTYRESVSPADIAAPALRLLTQPDALHEMQRDLSEVRAMLGEPGVAKRTADLIADLAAGRGAGSGPMPDG